MKLSTYFTSLKKQNDSRATDKKTLKHINKIVKRCSYGKDIDQLLSPDKDFFAARHNGFFLLANYFHADTFQANPKGICSELSYAVGKDIERKYGNEYKLVAGSGPCDRYFADGNHVFLLMWPKKVDTEVMVDFYDRSTREPEKGNFPRGVVLIDPSFKKVIKSRAKSTPMQKVKKFFFPQKTTGIQKYELRKLEPLENLSPEQQVFPLANRPITFPLGYTAKFIPDVDKSLKKSMLHIRFAPTDDNNVSVEPLIQKSSTDNSLERADYLLSNLPETHPLRMLWSKIESDMQVPLAEYLDNANPQTYRRIVHTFQTAFPNLRNRTD